MSKQAPRRFFVVTGLNCWFWPSSRGAPKGLEKREYHLLYACKQIEFGSGWEAELTRRPLVWPYDRRERHHCTVLTRSTLKLKHLLTAMSQVTKEVFMENTDLFPIKPVESSLSAPGRTSKKEGLLTAQESSKDNNGTTPIIDIFSQAIADMVDIHASVLFQALRSEKQYLRVQVRVLAWRRKKTTTTTTHFSLTNRTGVEAHAGEHFDITRKEKLVKVGKHSVESE
ncbi:hypothetical protein BHE74_00018749 [Ensete ventricosum]|nr:hypothetical protein BHE74_00018749 [Ensete ventricosum]